MMVKTEKPNCRECPVRYRSIMRDLESHLLDELHESKHCNKYEKGDIIFHENNYPMGLFAVYSGKVKIYKTNEYGKEQIIRLARPGDPLGYRSLISGDTYQATATVLETSRICFIPKTMFTNLMQTSTKLFARIIEVLSDDLKLAEGKISALATKTVRERTAEALIILKNYYGLEPDGITLSIQMSREDLANMVGTATESLIRMLSEFKADKLIVLKEKKIQLINIPKLQMVANMQD
jgi:CRP-like cAMP-binding protein